MRSLCHALGIFTRIDGVTGDVVRGLILTTAGGGPYYDGLIALRL
jgi:hypothetical protein